ncbi:HlyD family efflux transporter periplasmic adaptor subunit [Vulcanococcus limneticus]|uniref:HlyD family efflux transporter periplasmic adaptor subunit n=1 Tax=Vulcanococcus limneticus TaxID=2170428 RepID=UPI00398C1AA9
MAASSPQRGFSWMQRYRPWLIGALIGAGALAAWRLTRPKPVPPPKAPLVQQVTALGRLTPEGDLVTLSVPAGTSGGNEVVERWFVQEGDPIRQGQTLARLSSYGPLKAALEQAQANLSSTRALLPFLVISQSKGSELFADGAISEEELGKANAGVIRQQADIRGGSAALTRARRELAAAEVRSPLDGNLIRIYSWPGMKETDQGLALVGRTDRMQVWAQVFQSDVPRLRIGQRATVKPESGGFTGTLGAELASIIGVVSARDLFATNANNDVNARVVLVKLNLDPADRQRVARLSGLNVTVRFDP